MIKLVAIATPVAAVLALLLAAPASGQAPSAKPAAPLATPEKPESSVPPAPRERTRSRRNVDARECLKYPTNIEIHRCALKYL